MLCSVPIRGVRMVPKKAWVHQVWKQATCTRATCAGAMSGRRDPAALSNLLGSRGVSQVLRLSG